MTVQVKFNEESFQVSKTGMLCLPVPLNQESTINEILESKNNKSWNKSVSVLKERFTGSETRGKVNNCVIRFTMDNTNHAKRIASAFESFAKNCEDKTQSRIFALRARQIQAWIAYVSQ